MTTHCGGSLRVACLMTTTAGEIAASSVFKTTRDIDAIILDSSIIVSSMYLLDRSLLSYYNYHTRTIIQDTIILDTIILDIIILDTIILDTIVLATKILDSSMIYLVLSSM